MVRASERRWAAWVGVILAGIILGLGGRPSSAVAGTGLSAYEAPGVRFSLSLDLVPAKVLRTDCADYLWPAMADARLGLILCRVPRSGEQAAAVGARQRERLFGARGTTLPWKTLPFLGSPVTVARQSLDAHTGDVLYSCLVPLDRHWLFVGLRADRRLSVRVVERTWSEMSRSLRVTRKP